MKIRCLIVDDEELARSRMRSLLSEVNLSGGAEIEQTGEATNGKEALMAVRDHQPDLLLLDVQMPLLNGFDVAELLPQPRPYIIFVTAYDEYALQAFETHAVDYLMKPVRPERLEKALERIRLLKSGSQQQQALNELADARRQDNPYLQRLPLQRRDEIFITPSEQIIRFRADGKLVYAHTADQTYRVDFTLAELEERLHPDRFFRIHRSHIINLDKVDKLIPWFKGNYRIKLSTGTELDIARRRLPELKQKLELS